MSARPFNAESLEERVIAQWVAKRVERGFFRPTRNATVPIDLSDVLANGQIDLERGEVWIAGFCLTIPRGLLADAQ